MNGYFTSPSDVVALTRARASDLNTLDSSVDAAFDKLPSENNLKQGKVNYAVDTGGANAYAVALPYPPASYVDGLEVCFKAASTNSGAATINVNGLGVKSILNMDGTALAAGAIPINSFPQLRYNATTGMFVLLNTALNNTGVGSFATLSGVESLSNKTLESPVINNATFNNAVFTTQSQGDNSTKAATTAYVDTGLALKANVASPAFTGNPTAPTQSAGNNSTRLATTAYVDTADALKAPLADPTFSGVVSDASGGMRDIPQNVQNTAYSLVLTDRGKVVSKSDNTARAHTIPPNSSVAFPIGSVVTFENRGGSSNNLTVTRGVGVTLYRAGSNADIVVTPGDMVTCLKVATDVWQA